MNETLDLLSRHRSIRRFTDEPVPDADVRTAVAAGQRASTSSAIEAYCCLRIRDPQTRQELVELTGHQDKVARAGAFLAICGDTRRHRLIARRAGRPYEARLEAFLLAVVDAALFAQNLVIAFESLGYGICYVGGLRNRLFEVDRLLALPAGVYPLFGLCVGRPAEEPSPRPRLPLAAVLLEERYPDDEAMLALIDRHDEDVRAYYERRGATPQPWSARIAEKFSTLRRPDLAAYYARQGADLS
ncbi:MAG: NADPH-dependent oxidoreductase [Planctomycetota bacterium]